MLRLQYRVLTVTEVFNRTALQYSTGNAFKISEFSVLLPFSTFDATLLFCYGV